MTTKQQREIVIEFEKIKLIRKRARTTIEYCSKCDSEVDFVPAVLAAGLFEVETDIFFRSVNELSIHNEVRSNSTMVCVPSLLSTMTQRYGTGTKLIEGATLNDKDGLPESV